AESEPRDVGIQKLVNVNTASSAELQLLPGIGPVMAGRIIEDRTTNGLYRSPADLDRVKGIGPKTLEKLTPLIRFD
ncbi:MAG: ComEA family DNA-binding protein, partial [Phycisphaerales bacterium JB061]